MSRIKNALAALGGKPMAKEKEIKKEDIPTPPEPEQPKEPETPTETPVQEVEVGEATAESNNDNDDLVKQVLQMDFLTPQDVAGMTDADYKALTVNLLATILQELKKKQ